MKAIVLAFCLLWAVTLNVSAFKPIYPNIKRSSVRYPDSKLQANQSLDTVTHGNHHYVKKLNLTGRDSNFAVSFNEYTILDAEISNAAFSAPVDFTSSQFKNEAHFTYTEFQKNTSFKNASFFNDGNFGWARFDECVDFTYAAFHKSVRFENVRFGKFANFFNLSVDDTTTIDFSFSKLPDLIDFSGNGKLKSSVDFTDADLDSTLLYDSRNWHYINLYKSDISNIFIDYQHFRLCFYNNNVTDQGLKNAGILDKNDLSFVHLGGKLYHFSEPGLCDKLLANKEFQKYILQIFPTASLKDSVIHIFINHWLNSNNFPERLTDDEIKAIYEKTLKSFEAQGRTASYEELDIQYEDFKTGWWYFIPHYWYCYGYHKVLIFLWTAILLFLFTLVTFKYYDVLNKVNTGENAGVYYIDNIPQAVTKATEKNRLTAVMKNLWHSFAYTASIFFSLSINIENLNFKKVGVVYIVVVYILGILCLGYLANFILQK